MDVKNKKVKVTGEFDFPTDDLCRRIINHGGKVSAAKKVNFLFVGANPDLEIVNAAKERKIAIVEKEAVEQRFGALTHYIERWKDLLFAPFAAKPMVRYSNFPDPASDEEISEAEERLGFPLNEALRSFYSQTNGLLIGYRSESYEEYEKHQEQGMEYETEERKGPRPLSHFLSPSPKPELWKTEDLAQPGRISVGILHVPPITDLFRSSDLNETLAHDDVPGPDDIINVRGTRFNKKDFYEHLYMFDAHHGYAPTLLYANTIDQTFHCVVGNDHEACYTDVPPIDVETYFESALLTRGFERHFGNGQVVNAWWR